MESNEQTNYIELPQIDLFDCQKRCEKEPNSSNSFVGEIEGSI